MRPTVLWVIARLDIGGPARQANLLAKALRDDFPTLRESGVDVCYVPLVHRIQVVNDMRALKAIRGHVRSTHPAIVHSHMAKAEAIARASVRTVSVRPRTVHTFHGHVLERYFSKPVQQAFIAVERKLARQTDALVAVSEQIRDQLLDLEIGEEDQ